MYHCGIERIFEKQNFAQILSILNIFRDPGANIVLKKFQMNYKVETFITIIKHTKYKMFLFYIHVSNSISNYYIVFQAPFQSKSLTNHQKGPKWNGLPQKINIKKYLIENVSIQIQCFEYKSHVNKFYSLFVNFSTDSESTAIKFFITFYC